ncbi:hypothetical protein [Pseudomonas citrulli]|uniref:Uncharacterized protein n=1 Tax=Pseudomonas citrulli TaxID=3064347 RepID=A0ABT9BS19_9PSED|nr:hypothetical protein [Pseudomonas sp. K18]MDO7895297.1 hypothetical protein [Pseudomonas sp. K18]
MTITMFLEIESGATLGTIQHVVQNIANTVTVGKNSLEGYFSASNGFFYFEMLEPPSTVSAEGCMVDWLVGVMGAFHCPLHELEQSWREIRHVMEELSLVSSARFVFSFQYDSVYALNEGHGVVYKKSMVV